MHIADCMSRNSLPQDSTGRSDHTEPSGIWMDDAGAKVATGKWELDCGEMTPQKVSGYEVGPQTMFVQCELVQVRQGPR